MAKRVGHVRGVGTSELGQSYPKLADLKDYHVYIRCVYNYIIRIFCMQRKIIGENVSWPFFFILISGPPITLLVVFPFNQNYLKDLSATCRALWFVDNIIKISIGIFILFSLLS